MLYPLPREGGRWGRWGEGKGEGEGGGRQVGLWLDRYVLLVQVSETSTLQLRSDSSHRVTSGRFAVRI